MWRVRKCGKWHLVEDFKDLASTECPPTREQWDPHVDVALNSWRNKFITARFSDRLEIEIVIETYNKFITQLKKNTNLSDRKASWDEIFSSCRRGSCSSESLMTEHPSSARLGVSWAQRRKDIFSANLCSCDNLTRIWCIEQVGMPVISFLSFIIRLVHLNGNQE